MAAARKAFKHSSWKSLSGTERGVLMMKLANLMEEHAEILATIECLDNGKPYSVALNENVPEVVNTFNWYNKVYAISQKVDNYIDPSFMGAK